MSTQPASSSRSVVLVVGASGGIGQAAAQRLLGDGHIVYGTARDATRVQEPGVIALSMDVTQPSSVEAAIHALIAQAGRLDAVVYSAGFYSAGAAEETSDTLMFDQFDTFVFGVHRVTRAVLPRMRAQGFGKLIYMSSAAATAAIPFHPAYSASKGALEHYADGLRYEVEPLGIQVSCIRGTGVRTSAIASCREAEPRIAAYQPRRDAAVRGFRALLQSGPHPHAHARAISQAVRAHRMRPHYSVDLSGRLFAWAKAILPMRAFRAVALYHFEKAGRH